MLISNQLSQLQLHLSKPDLKNIIKNLQPGQLLKATVVSQATDNAIKLKIGTQELIAYTRLQLAIGQKLTMEVTKTGDRPELRLLRERSSSELQNQFLRQALPRQIPQAKFFNALQTIGRTSPELLQKLLPALLQKSMQEQGQKSDSQLSQKTDSKPLQQALNELLSRAAQKSTESPSAAIKALLQKTADAPLQKQSASKTQSSNLHKAIQAILAKVLPQASTVSAPQIRQALLNSGLFLEANLAFGHPAQAAGDLKANLLNLLVILRTHLQSEQEINQQLTKKLLQLQNPKAAASNSRSLLQLLGELFRQTEGSLARIQTHQLSSLPTEESLGQAWRFELPVQQSDRIDSFLIRLEQEQNTKDDQAGSTWKITLNFDFSPLGPIEAKLSLRGEEISAVFLAEQADSATLLSQNLTRLHDAFIRVGLKVDQLHSQQGKISPLLNTPATLTALLDEKA